MTVWNLECESPLLSAGEPDVNSDRHDLDRPLLTLHCRYRLHTDDRPQGRTVRLPRLRPYSAPRHARVQMHLPPLLGAIARANLD